MKTIISSIIFLITLTASNSFADNTAQQSVSKLQKLWAKANYELQGKEQTHAFENLLTISKQALETNPEQAEILIWDGIIKSSFAGVKGGLGALSLVKQSRQSLEQALKIDDSALHGSAYTSLGILYAKVPGWPIAFGSQKKAEKFLKKALELNPDGIDSNYFYAVFLMDKGNYTQAQEYLHRAQKAVPRPHRPLADKGRHQEIENALNELEKKINS